jgi:hypothetical protein
MALFVNPVYDSPAGFQGPALTLATLAFAIQIYCDFSGYSDIAFGSAQVMGIRLMKNFNHPYYARSIPEFWQRWHISLSTWFRDYVYIPLGGSRAGTRRTLLNLLITFLVSGLWHGANWTFVIWGGLHGMYAILGGFIEPYATRLREREGAKRFSRVLNSLSLLATFGLVSFAWIFFRASSLGDAAYIVRNLGNGWGNLVVEAYDVLRLAGNAGSAMITDVPFDLVALATSQLRGTIFLTGISLLIFGAVEAVQYRGDLLVQINRLHPFARLGIYLLLVIMTVTLGTAYTGMQQEFIYFQF